MKMLLVSFFVLIASSASCLADNLSVVLGTTTPCTFSASAITDGFTNTTATGSASSGAGAGKVTFNPFTIVKSLDNCSIPLFAEVLRGTAIPTVQITISGTDKKPLLVITLKEVFVTSITDSDSDSPQGAFSEKVTLVYGSINMQDLADNTTTTCDVTTNTCS
jgi:type VI protein secretion system component Hcp